MRDNRNDLTPYAVYCGGHIEGHNCGLVFLTGTQYEQQLDHPNALWKCPKCGAEASWDDECQATNPAEAEGRGK